MIGLREQDVVEPFEIVLVDSGSTDGTPEIASALGARVIHIDKREFTFGRALNIGCREATGEILVFVSAHVYPTRTSWLSDLLAPFDDGRVVLSYGKQRGNAVNKFSEHQIFARWFPEEAAFPQRGYFCNNANCAVRRASWEDLPYDEALPGLEDLAWAKEMQRRGGWLAYAPSADIVHVHDETWAAIRNRYRREAMAMKQIDEHARFSMWDFATLFIKNCAADYREAMKNGVLATEFLSIGLFRWNQFFGTYLGYHGAEELSLELRRRFYFPNTKPFDRTETEGSGAVIEYEKLEQHLLDASTRNSNQSSI